MKPLKGIDQWLTETTMYRIMLYGLTGLLVIAIIFSATGELSLSIPALVSSVVVLMIACYVSNKALATLFHAHTNLESWVITAYILACIIPPGNVSAYHLALVAGAGVIAMASKYLLSIYRKHLFNPAAAAMVILGLTGVLSATWWVGSPILVPFTLIFAILILRKIRRFQLFFSFLIASIIVSILVGHSHDQIIGYTLNTLFKSSPLIFLGSVMLTEPSTTPPRVWQQRIYGALVGILFTSEFRLGFISATPELALVLGNVYAYVVSPKFKLRLKLVSLRQLAPHIYDFGFASDMPLHFRAGQYLEWTLPHPHSDKRGNRRTFSIASAPTDNELHLAIKTYEPGSSFKKALLALQPGDTITGGQLAGDFVLPKDPTKKLVFIAGGIGVTPFVSMVSAITTQREPRDVLLIYLVSDIAEYCYQDIWKAAAQYGVKVIPVLGASTIPASWHGLTGRLTADMISQEIPDFKTRRFYVSGPNALVDAYKHLLKTMGVPQKQLVTDHFTGY